MSYTLVPISNSSLYPLQRTRYVETVVRNMTSNELFFGFLGPHGKRLKGYQDSSARDFYTMPGNLEQYLQSSPGHRKKRMYDHYLNALVNNIIRVTVNSRDVYYAAVANATAFAIGDLCYWDDSAKLAKPASSFTWDTNIATTQAEFADVFLGVCLDAKTASDGKVLLRFDKSPLSAFDFTIAAGTAYKIGQGFGPAKASGNALLANKVAAAVNTSSCLRLVANMTNTDTQVLLAPASAYSPSNSENALG
jgi:hypothetical protein